LLIFHSDTTLSSMKVQTKRPLPLLQPVPICLVGTMVKERPNFTTIGDVAVAGIQPALIMISIHSNHACMEFINTHKQFSINVPTTDMIKKVDYAGIYSGHSVDKSSLFETTFVGGIPTVNACPISLIVKEVKRIQIEHRVILVCKVTESYINESLVRDGTLKLDSLSSIAYGLDNRYYEIGVGIGTGYQVGNIKQ